MRREGLVNNRGRLRLDSLFFYCGLRVAKGNLRVGYVVSPEGSCMGVYDSYVGLHIEPQQCLCGLERPTPNVFC